MTKNLFPQTILNKILGKKKIIPVKLDRNEKLSYLLLRTFLAVIDKAYFLERRLVTRLNLN